MNSSERLSFTAQFRNGRTESYMSRLWEAALARGRRVCELAYRARARAGFLRLGRAGLTILGYHRVVRNNSDSLENFDGTEISAERFEEQLRILLRFYKPISLTGSRFRGGEGSAQPLLAVTFDDGYADNAELAWPILHRLGVPATFFLTTGFLDGSVQFWSDRLRLAVMQTWQEALATREASSDPMPLRTKREKAHCLSTLFSYLKGVDDDRREEVVNDLCQQCGVEGSPPARAPMTWEQLRRMVAEGAEVGGHTITHPILSRVSVQRAQEEIVGCKTRLEEQLGIVVKTFAYPNGGIGDFTSATMDAVARAGYETAVTAIPGINGLDANLSMRRIVVNGNHSTGRLLRQLKLLGKEDPRVVPL